MFYTLITGGCGYIGSHLCLLFKEYGLRIVVIDDLSTGCLENKLYGVLYEIGDFGNPLFLDMVFKNIK